MHFCTPAPPLLSASSWQPTARSSAFLPYNNRQHLLAPPTFHARIIIYIIPIVLQLQLLAFRLISSASMHMVASQLGLDNVSCNVHFRFFETSASEIFEWKLIMIIAPSLHWADSQLLTPEHFICVVFTAASTRRPHRDRQCDTRH